MAQLQHTRLKLTIILSSIVALLFFVVWESFFGFKFYSNTAKIKSEVTNIQQIISSESQEIFNFIQNQESWWENTNNDTEINKILSFTKKLFEDPNTTFEDIGGKQDVADIIIKWKSEFSFFDQKVIFYDPSNKKVLYSNIWDANDINIDEFILQNNWVSYSADLVQYKFKLIDIVWVTFIKREYTSHEFFTDTWMLLLFILLFSLVFFALGSYFIKRIFKPVEENIREMDNFIDNAWHELKTPLAAISSSSQLLKEIKNYEEDLVQEIIVESNKSNEIIQALRSLSKISIHSKSESLSLNSEISRAVEWMQQVAKSKNISLIFEQKADSEIQVNKNYLYILLTNLIWNAIKYNKTWWSVTVESSSWEITISDTGIWIPKDKLSSVFERFFRWNNHQNIWWYGLWLSLVKKICDIYNWKISVESIEWVGTKIKILI